MSLDPRPLVRRWAARAVRRQHGDRRLAAQAFDRDWYLSTNPDVAQTRADPLDHFLSHGWREGRDPSPRFSLDEYLDNNPDIAESGVNPLLHWLKHGQAEGRPTAHNLGFRHQVLRRLKPIDEQIEAARRATGAVRTASTDALVAALGRARYGLKDVHITFSHDDYRASLGGVQLCLHLEAQGLAARGRDHLQMHPAVTWPSVRVAGEEGRLEVVLNGQTIGVHPPAAVAEALARVGRLSGDRSFAIHSLLGHEAGETAAIVEAAGLNAGAFWLHDFASLCVGVHLLRDGVEDCGAPPPTSGACGICVYGPARARHLEAHATLFRRLSLTVASPAQVTLDLWRRAWDFPAVAEVVHPHVTLRPREPAPVVAGPRPLRVAYAGVPVAHKGWALFRELVLRHEGDRRYEFHHLGVAAERGLPLTCHEVRVGADRPQAMRDALEALEVDVLVFWSLARETFSFTVHEAVAAGCAVITGPDSGNVAAVVAEGGHGWVLSEAEVGEAFASGRVAELSRAARRPMLYDLAFSGMSLDLATR